MFELLLKASLAIATAFLFYKIVLQQESFFATNRCYLLGCLVLAFILPFITLPQLINQQGMLTEVFEQKISLKNNTSEKAVPESTPVHISGTSSMANPDTMPEVISEETSAMTSTEKELIPLSENLSSSEDILPAENPSEAIAETSEYSLMFWITALYLFGVGIFSLSLLFQLGYIAYQVITAADKIRDGGYVIVNTAERKAPCSFFNYIFIFPDDYDFETYEQIIAHEKTHVRLGHSFDLLFAELAVIALWFNPFVWFLKKEIEKNNEYQTDSILLEKEKVRKDKYQLNLLQIAVPNKPLNITTNYNQSLIKQRILMMNSKRSTPHAYWKYAFLAPLFLGILLLMNEPATAQEQQQQTAAKVEKEPAAAEENRSKDFRNRKENVLREREEIVERREIMQRERENLVDRSAVATQQRERLQERAEEVRAQRENIRQRVEERRSLAEGRNISLTGRTSRQDMTKGVWYSSIKNGRYCIELRGGHERSGWNMSNCYDRSAFKKNSSNAFFMSNEVGTLELKGNLDAEVGQGTYIFTENASFRNFLVENDISQITSNNLFHLFLGDFTKDYVSYLKQQYEDVDGEDLTSLAIHGIKQNDFRNYVSLFEGHSGGKAGIKNVVALKIHRVTEDYIAELREMGFEDLSMNKIMTAKIHGISADYSRDLKNAGFKDLSINDIITAKIHGVTPETIKEMKALGAQDLNEIVKLKIHNVSPAYVKELRAAGLGNLSLDQVVAAKIHGLNAASIQEIKALGFPNLGYQDLLTAKIHRVDPAFVKDLEKAGFKDLDIKKVVSARIHGITGDFIEKARKDGYDLNSIDKYISLKIHGRALESLKEQ